MSWPSKSTSVGFLYVFSINLASDDILLVQNPVTVNTPGNLFSFDLTQLTPRLEPYEVVIYGAAEGGTPIESGTTEIYYLPEKSNGSVARIDNLDHRIYWKNAASNGVFEPLLDYGYYSSFDEFLGADNSTALVDEYVAYGLTGMTPLTQYPDGQISLDSMNSINLPWMEDLRELPEPDMGAREGQLSQGLFLFVLVLACRRAGWLAVCIRYHDLRRCCNQGAGSLPPRRGGPELPELLLWRLHSGLRHHQGRCLLDRYQQHLLQVGHCMEHHPGPTAVVITARAIRRTCRAGWTICTSTRTGLASGTRPRFHNPQSFHGEDYWSRGPTVDVEFVMNTLAFSHGAKSVISWVYPASDVLNTARGQLAQVVSKSPVVDFIVPE